MTNTQPVTKPRTARARGAGYEAPAPVPVARRRMGRPEIEVEPEMIRLASAMAKLGATDIEMARELGISEKSFYTICGRNPQFLQAVREGKEAANDRAEQSMYRTAVGFTVQTEKVFSNGFRTTVEEYIPPNPGALMNFLRNRRNWRSGDNVAQDAIDAAAALATDEPASTKTLALAALALLTTAAAGAQAPGMIDVTPNETPTPARAAEPLDEDGEPHDEAGSEEPFYDDRDPDFDF